MPNDCDQQTRIKDLSIEGLRTLALSLFLAFGIRVGVAESFFIPTLSMAPTLQIDDRLMVDKVGYRFNLPERGDIIVFQPTEQALKACGLPLNFRDSFVKRLIGLPGEQIEIKDGWVYINGYPLTEPYLAEKPEYRWGPMTVPTDSYLVLGDNRNSSCDSHAWGFVPRDHIIGRAFVRFWPVGRFGPLSELSEDNSSNRRPVQLSPEILNLSVSLGLIKPSLQPLDSVYLSSNPLRLN